VVTGKRIPGQGKREALISHGKADSKTQKAYSWGYSIAVALCKIPQSLVLGSKNLSSTVSQDHIGS